jgi:hypothetical protein
MVRNDSLKWKKIEEIMWIFGSLNYKYRIIFKLKRNGKKLIDSWDIKTEKNWENFF